MFNKGKWDSRDILFIFDDLGEPVFYACVCIKLGEKGKRKYEWKDLKVVDKLLGTIQRRSLVWWQVKESKTKTAYYLYYYPRVHHACMVEAARKRRSPYIPQFSNTLKNLRTTFNYMVK